MHSLLKDIQNLGSNMRKAGKDIREKNEAFLRIQGLFFFISQYQEKSKIQVYSTLLYREICLHLLVDT